jgi:hypothetical protein
MGSSSWQAPSAATCRTTPQKECTTPLIHLTVWRTRPPAAALCGLGVRSRRWRQPRSRAAGQPPASQQPAPSPPSPPVAHLRAAFAAHGGAHQQLAVVAAGRARCHTRAGR